MLAAVTLRVISCAAMPPPIVDASPTLKAGASKVSTDPATVKMHVTIDLYDAPGVIGDGGGLDSAVR